MRMHVGIYDADFTLRYPPNLKDSLSLFREVVGYYPCECKTSLCAVEDARNEFLPDVGAIHVRPESPLRVAAFLGRALRNFYGPKAKRFALFHASAVEWRGEAIIFVGEHASGKSTLLRGFLREGFGYLADDMVALNPRDGRVYPTLPVDVRYEGLIVSPPVPLRWVFLVRFSGDVSRSVVEEIEPYEAYLRMTENLLNPSALSGEGLATLLKVLSSAERFRTLHGDWRDVLSAVKR
ncbi:MAG: hypothetical protein GXO29_00545 [Thermotogae bacterium]|nr:hypothetical protein [Thermotogota bacterium]